MDKIEFSLCLTLTPASSLPSPRCFSSVTVGIDLLFVKPVLLSLYSGTEKAKRNERETFTLEFTINEEAKNKMLEYFACFTAHYTTTATSREVPDRETGNFLIFSLARGGAVIQTLR